MDFLMVAKQLQRTKNKAIRLIQSVIQLADIRVMDNILPHIALANGYSATWNDNNSPNQNNEQQGGANTGTNWMDLCNKISFALISSCDTLVNSDNTLTTAGMHAHDCIQMVHYWLAVLFY